MKEGFGSEKVHGSTFSGDCEEERVKVKIDDIKIKRRIRKDIGDISDLVDSINRFGLLNPITISPKMVLIAGYRRLEACRALGVREVECRMVSAASKIDRLIIEADENMTRKDLTIHEIEIFEDEKRYLQARGMQKLWFWLIRIMKGIRNWFRRVILRRRD